MNAPDFEITALLVLRKFIVHVIAARRGRPHLDDERQRKLIELQAPGMAELLPRGSRWDNEDIRNVKRSCRLTNTGGVEAHAEFAPIDLSYQLCAERGNDVVVLEAHVRLAPQQS